MSAPAQITSTEPSPGSRLTAPAVAVAAFLVVALGLSWWRLLRGVDLLDESFSVLVPWRWSLGDRPFVDEQNLTQSAGLLAYPFVKLFALVRGENVAGLVLYERHLYLALAVVVAACVFGLARRSLPASLAALVGAPFVTIVLFETPQLTANTLGALLLVAGAALGAVAVLGGSRWYALAAGAVFGLACVAYPTMLLMAPFVAIFLAFSVGERAVLMVAQGSFLHPPAGESEPTGRRAWRALSAWSLGGVLVLVPVAGLMLAMAGRSNLRRCWDYTIGLARQLDQLGGASKAVEVSGAFAGLLLDQWYIVAVAVLSLLLFRLRPGVGRWLLLLTPPALWLTATTSSLHAAGAVIVYALAAPYLFLFVPPERREDGARLLLWIWLPALLVGAMTAYTSADGFVHSAVGLLPGVVASGLFLAWGLGAIAAGSRRTLARSRRARRHRRGDLGVPGAVPGWRGRIERSVRAHGLRSLAGDSRHAARRSAGLDRFAADLASEARPGDQLLVYPEGAAYYLYWPGEIAANTYQLYVADAQAPLPKSTVSYYRRHREVPTLVVHLTETAGKSPADLTARLWGA